MCQRLQNVFPLVLDLLPQPDWERPLFDKPGQLAEIGRHECPRLIRCYYLLPRMAIEKSEVNRIRNALKREGPVIAKLGTFPRVPFAILAVKGFFLVIL